eukprot:scaffold11721_cov172-Ochromonas_danica.AAC.2
MTTWNRLQHLRTTQHDLQSFMMASFDDFKRLACGKTSLWGVLERFPGFQTQVLRVSPPSIISRHFAVNPVRLQQTNKESEQSESNKFSPLLVIIKT